MSIIKKYIYRVKVSKNILIQFWKKLHCSLTRGYCSVKEHTNTFFDLSASASFLAEISVKSPRNFFFIYFLKKCFLDQSVHKMFYLNLMTAALQVTIITCNVLCELLQHLSNTRVRSVGSVQTDVIVSWLDAQFSDITPYIGSDSRCCRTDCT